MIDKEYKLEVNSDPANLPQIEKFILGILSKLNLSKEKTNNISLSIAEAASNSMVHGNNADPGKYILISVRITDSEVLISMKDEGSGFDPKSIPDPTLPTNIFKDHGRGIHIIKSFMDDVKYNFSDGGTEILMKVNLD